MDVYIQTSKMFKIRNKKFKDLFMKLIKLNNSEDYQVLDHIFQHQRKNGFKDVKLNIEFKDCAEKRPVLNMEIFISITLNNLPLEELFLFIFDKRVNHNPLLWVSLVDKLSTFEDSELLSCVKSFKNIVFSYPLQYLILLDDITLERSPLKLQLLKLLQIESFIEVLQELSHVSSPDDLNFEYYIKLDIFFQALRIESFVEHENLSNISVTLKDIKTKLEVEGKLINKNNDHLVISAYFNFLIDYCKIFQEKKKRKRQSLLAKT